MAGRPAYDRSTWTRDLRHLVQVRGCTVTVAASTLGISRRTAYRLIDHAKQEGRW